MKAIWMIIGGWLAMGTIHAQGYSRTGNGLKATVNDISIEIRFYTPGIVRIVKSPEGHSYTKESLSVIAQPQPVNVDIRQEGNRVILKTDSLEVDLDLQTGKLAFDDLSGNLLLTEKDYGTQFSSTGGVDKLSYIVR